MDRLDCSKTRTMAIGQRVALLLVRNLVAFTLLVLSLPSLSLSFYQQAWTSHNRRAAVFRGPTAISQGTPCQQQRHVRYRPIVGLGAGGGAGAGGGGGERDGSSSFRTEVDVAPWPMVNYLTYADSFLLIGSCFSDNVGERLRVSKFHSAVNPSHGLLFSPLSMADSLDRMASGVPYSESEPGVVFCEDTGLFCSLEHHSSFSKTSRCRMSSIAQGEEGYPLNCDARHAKDRSVIEMMSSI